MTGPHPAQPSTAGHRLSLNKVTISRRGMTLIDALNVTVEPGQVLGVAGPSGCGKTTLLRAIAGLTRDVSGTIQTPTGRVAVVFQEPRLLPWRDAVTNVALALPGVAPAERLTRATTWLRRVGLGDALTLYPGHMSGGMRQRVAIARAMVTQPKLLLVDEPFSALDADLSVSLRGELGSLIKEHKPVTVWVTHDEEERTAIASTSLLLSGPPGHWELVQVTQPPRTAQSA